MNLPTPITAPRPPRLFRAMVQPLQAFFRTESAGSAALLASTLLGLAWANSPWAHTYLHLLSAPLTFEAWGGSAHATLATLVNDGLMTLFFFVVGMEIKRELVAGELKDRAQALLPLSAAAGGMAAPALLYLLFTAGTPAAVGWGIPMATDIAFAMGLLRLLGARVSHALTVFLLALAVFDDLGGILVIAIFYGHGLDLPWLGGALVATVAALAAGRYQVRSGLVYLALGGALWWALHAGGLHATLAGVVLGLAIPTRPRRAGREVLEDLRRYAADCLAREGTDSLAESEVAHIEKTLEDVQPPLTQFLHLLHPYVAFGVVPLFALVNAGIPVAGLSASDFRSPVFFGIVAGLVLGKPIGIVAATWLLGRLGGLRVRGNPSVGQLTGVGAVAGIGFTVALFIAQLAFAGSAALLLQAKLAILVGSAVSALAGFVVLRFAARSEPSGLAT